MATIPRRKIFIQYSRVLRTYFSRCMHIRAKYCFPRGRKKKQSNGKQETTITIVAPPKTEKREEAGATYFLVPSPIFLLNSSLRPCRVLPSNPLSICCLSLSARKVSARIIGASFSICVTFIVLKGPTSKIVIKVLGSLLSKWTSSPLMY